MTELYKSVLCRVYISNGSQLYSYHPSRYCRSEDLVHQKNVMCFKVGNVTAMTDLSFEYGIQKEHKHSAINDTRSKGK